jgi:hypothetical protein
MAPLFLNLALIGGEWLTSGPVRFTPRKEPRYPLNRRLGDPTEETNLLTHRDFNPAPSSPQCSRLTDDHLVGSRYSTNDTWKPFHYTGNMK